jgi:virginiamycin B lyase
MFVAAATLHADTSITEFTTPSSGTNLEDITLGPDGAMWFAESSVSKIGRITTAGVVTEYGLAGGRPVGITQGPDGALWFTLVDAAAIGRITTTGEITQYPVGRTPFRIASGPDGALWFTEDSDNRIARITTAGAFTEYPIPTANSEPTYIAAGPDGALWFVEFNANKIGRITTAGVITEFAVQRAGIGGITTGPDGALWFTSYYGNYIERIDSAGTVTEYPLPFTTLDIFGITRGPDEALWFASETGIGRIAADGAATEYAVPTANSNPVAIASGPGGTIWFTENATDKVGRITLTGATSPSINPGGVVNGASFTEGVVPGSIASAFGVFLLTSTAGATALPLSNGLLGLSLQFGNGEQAPLFYVSGSQVNFQVPWDLAGPAEITLAATINGQTGPPQSVAVVPYAPGIFSTNSQGTGQGAIQDSSYRLVDPSNPATAGSSVVLIYCTGLGSVTNQPPTGSPALDNPLSWTVTTPSVAIGGAPAPVQFYGLAPGYVGLYQVNALVPSASTKGYAVPVTISMNAVTSNTVTIAVQ